MRVCNGGLGVIELREGWPQREPEILYNGFLTAYWVL
jgi:hypothetical protein